VVQVDPIKPTLKPPRMKHSKLRDDEPLSSSAFTFNLCRFNPAEFCGTPQYMCPDRLHERPYGEKTDVWALGRAVQVDPMKTHFERAWR